VASAAKVKPICFPTFGSELVEGPNWKVNQGLASGGSKIGGKDKDLEEKERVTRSFGIMHLTMASMVTSGKACP
jgi:hypothetical protein